MKPLSVLRDSLYFFRNNLWAIVQLCLPLVMLEALATHFIEQTKGGQGSTLAPILVGLMFYPLYTGALILFLDERSRGQHPAARDLLAKAIRMWPFFASLAAMNLVLIMLGMSLYLLPGIWVMVKLAFAEYSLVLRGRKPLSAMRDSIEMTSGFFWPILICIMAVMLPLWLLDGFSAMAWADQQNSLVQVLIDGLNGFLQLLNTVVVFRLFMLLSDPEQRSRLQ
jgi:hypothetical protein